MTFKKDSLFLGLFIGLAVPFLCYLLQMKLIPKILGYSFANESMQLFALVCNVPFLRFFLLKLDFEAVGKGILFATFIYALLWVYINQISI